MAKGSRGGKRMTKQELVKFLIENFTDKFGDLDLAGLDFRGFKGNVDISRIIVDNDLNQNCQDVGGNLSQSRSRVGGTLSQIGQTVGCSLDQRFQTVGGNTYQDALKEETQMHKENIDSESTENCLIDLVILILTNQWKFEYAVLDNDKFALERQIAVYPDMFLSLWQKGYKYDVVNAYVLKIYDGMRKHNNAEAKKEEE